MEGLFLRFGRGGGCCRDGGGCCRDGGGGGLGVVDTLLTPPLVVGAEVDEWCWWYGDNLVVVV